MPSTDACGNPAAHAAAITAIINQKGGVGKSTTAHALGAGLRERGLRVLFIDLDAQMNLSHTLGAVQGHPSALSVLTRACAPAEAVQALPGGHLIPGDLGLSAMDMLLSDTGKEYRLREALEGFSGQYDQIIIDTPPALGILTVNALTAAGGIVIPAQADVYSLQGISQLYGTVETVRRYCNPALSIMGILLTRFNPRAVLTRDITAAIEENARALGTRLFGSRIREGIAIREAQAARQSVFEYAPKSNAAMDYAAFVAEFLGMGEA